jgi:hypothetical protein
MCSFPEYVCLLVQSLRFNSCLNPLTFKHSASDYASFVTGVESCILQSAVYINLKFVEDVSEMSFSIYQTIRCNIPEDSHIHTRRLENSKSHFKFVIFYFVALYIMGMMLINFTYYFIAAKLIAVQIKHSIELLTIFFL